MKLYCSASNDTFFLIYLQTHCEFDDNTLWIVSATITRVQLDAYLFLLETVRSL